MYTGSNNPAAAIGDIKSDRIGTASAATTGKPPFPRPTKIDANMAAIQKAMLVSIVFPIFARLLSLLHRCKIFQFQSGNCEMAGFSKPRGGRGGQINLLI